jgi:hypothetical protein
MLVGQGNPHFVDRNGTLDRHDDPFLRPTGLQEMNDEDAKHKTHGASSLFEFLKNPHMIR